MINKTVFRVAEEEKYEEMKTTSFCLTIVLFADADATEKESDDHLSHSLSPFFRENNLYSLFLFDA
jgi:hypothetical protein